VQSRPGIDDADLVTTLADAWGFAVTELAYAPVGFGSHHWIVEDATGAKRFVTVDELDRQGSTRTETMTTLRGAFTTALALRGAGLDFVIAPLPAVDGSVVRPLDDDLSVAVFPYVEGSSRGFGAVVPEAERTETLEMLAALHRAVPPESCRRDALDQPAARRTVEEALAALGRAWDGGPFAEPARAWLSEHASEVQALLAEVVDLAARVGSRGIRPVVTHGEPHPGNILRTGAGLALIDWDTVALAPPERDLWSLVPDGGPAADRYVELTGRAIDPEAMRLYRRAWPLTDLAVYLHDFREPHEHDEDSEMAWRVLHELQIVDAP
jgi:spectinomycin phosphotransferase